MLQQSHRMQTVSKPSSRGIPHQRPEADETDNNIPHCVINHYGKRVKQNSASMAEVAARVMA